MAKKFLLVTIIIASIFVLAIQAQAFNGRVKWSKRIDASVTTGMVLSGNKLIFGDSAGKLHAFVAATGAQLWEYEGSSMIVGTPVVVNDNVIFAQTDGVVSCVNLSGGSLVWSYIPAGDTMLSDGAAYGNGLVFTARNDGTLVAIDAATCNDAWTYQARQGLRTAPAYGEGLVFQGEYDGLFSMIDAKTGERVNGGGAGAAVNTPIVNKGKVYFSAADGTVQSIQIKDVIPLWTVKVPDPINTSPVLGDGIIAVGTARGYVFALRESDGNFMWQYDTQGGSVNAKPVIANGLVFAASSDGELHVLNAKNGRELRSFTAQNGVENSPAYSGGVLYLGDTGGNVYALQ